MRVDDSGDEGKVGSELGAVKLSFAGYSIDNIIIIFFNNPYSARVDVIIHKFII